MSKKDCSRYNKVSIPLKPIISTGAITTISILNNILTDKNKFLISSSGMKPLIHHILIKLFKAFHARTAFHHNNTFHNLFFILPNKLESKKE